MPETDLAAAWATEQLSEFVTLASGFDSEVAAAQGFVERVAEALDAEIVAIVSGQRLVAVVGYPEGEAPVADIVAAATGIDGELTIPGAGRVKATAVALDYPPGGTMVVARSGGGGFSRSETSVLRGMARMAAIRMRSLHLLEELAASRARVVMASDATRRRIERNLHDGVQQRLVTLALEMRGAIEAAASQPDEQDRLVRIERGLQELLEEIREISRGLHPAILSEAGLTPALRSLARRSRVPVELDLRCEERLPGSVEVAAYYLISEALTNVAKHAQASTTRITVEPKDGRLRIEIQDDGVGGADPARGSGLIGLTDRVEALGGTVAVSSPSGSGTTIIAQIPIRLR